MATDFLGLNQWEPGSNSTREQFNEDNRRIDAGVKELHGLFQSGTWTPELSDFSGNFPEGYSIQTGCWAKVGNLISLWGRIQLDGTSKLTGTQLARVIIPTSLHGNAEALPIGTASIMGFLWQNSNARQLTCRLSAAGNLVFYLTWEDSPTAAAGLVCSSFHENAVIMFQINYPGV